MKTELPKYLARRLAEPGILIFKEKHGERFFFCNTPEEFGRAAMKILKERAGEEFCWYGDDPKDPDTSLTRAKEIIKDKDYVAAFMFLDARSDWEYEHMDIEYPEKF